MTVFVIYKNLMNLSGILSLGKAYFSIRNFMKSGFCSILSEYTLSIYSLEYIYIYIYIFEAVYKRQPTALYSAYLLYYTQ